MEGDWEKEGRGGLLPQMPHAGSTNGYYLNLLIFLITQYRSHNFTKVGLNFDISIVFYVIDF